MVCQSIKHVLKPNKLIPFAALSTAFLFGFSNKASAFSPNEGIITKILTNEEDKSVIEELTNALENILNFFHNIRFYTAKWSIDLLTWIYETLANVVFTTPHWLFNNTFFTNTSLQISIISMFLIIALTMIEGYKQMSKFRHTRLKTILKRTGIAVAVAGSMPFILSKLFAFLNKITDAIISIGVNEIQWNKLADNIGRFSSIDVFGLALFDILLIGLCVPILLQNGRRWFDLVALGVMTPMAMTCWIFDNHKHLFRQWFNTLKRLSLVQLVYAFFLTLLGLLIFATPTPLAPQAIMTKMLITIGGLWRMCSPPQIVVRFADGGSDIGTIFEDLKNGLTLKKPRNKFKSMTKTLGINKFIKRKGSK